jgi:hypothetical protein
MGTTTAGAWGLAFAIACTCAAMFVTPLDMNVAALRYGPVTGRIDHDSSRPEARSLCLFFEARAGKKLSDTTRPMQTAHDCGLSPFTEKAVASTQLEIKSYSPARHSCKIMPFYPAPRMFFVDLESS